MKAVIRDAAQGTLPVDCYQHLTYQAGYGFLPLKSPALAKSCKFFTHLLFLITLFSVYTYPSNR